MQLKPKSGLMFWIRKRVVGKEREGKDDDKRGKAMLKNKVVKRRRRQD